MLLRLTILTSSLLVLAAHVPPARAQDTESRLQLRAELIEEQGPDLEWSYRETDYVDYIAMGAAISSLLVTTALGPREAPNRGGVLFDESIRDALRAPTEGGRHFARDVSDVLLAASWSWPLLIDSFLVAGYVHRAPEVLLEMQMINLETIAITAALQSLWNVLMSRERPFGRTCGAELPGEAEVCDESDRFYSFFSGHTSQTFASAALTCSHHMHLPLYGGGPVELAPCIGGLATATATGLLRIVGDKHYASDVFVGAVVGTGLGFFLPWLLHYRVVEPDAGNAAEAGVEWSVVPTPTGAAAVGTF